MATRTTFVTTDDLDGTVLGDVDAHSLALTLEGKHYEIDLSATNAARLREVLAPYIAASRKLPRRGRPRSSTR